MTGYHHFIHAAISMARKFLGDKWPMILMFQDAGCMCMCVYVCM